MNEILVATKVFIHVYVTLQASSALFYCIWWHEHDMLLGWSKIVKLMINVAAAAGGKCFFYSSNKTSDKAVTVTSIKEINEEKVLLHQHRINNEKISWKLVCQTDKMKCVCLSCRLYVENEQNKPNWDSVGCIGNFNYPCDVYMPYIEKMYGIVLRRKKKVTESLHLTIMHHAYTYNVSQDYCIVVFY